MSTLPTSTIIISLLQVATYAPRQPSSQSPVPGLTDKVEEAFRTGNALMNEKKYCEALTRYGDGLTLAPDDTSLLYNGGLAAFRCKRYSSAEDLWRRLKGIDPTDWQTRAKLIQTYQALEQLTHRDAERSELFDIWKQGKNDDLSKQIEYCRDQFEVAGEKVMAFEQFELKGERLFHLDGYYKWGHATYGMYSPEPSYDETRKIVIQILENKRTPVSTSTTSQKPK